MDKPIKSGSVRVGSITFGPIKVPEYEGFTEIKIMTRNYGKWFPLSPYELKTKEGYIMENVWQFSKVYEKIPAAEIKQHPRSNKITWKWQAETHIDDDGNLLPEYWHWRKSGFEHKEWVRYPFAKQYMSNCKYALSDREYGFEKTVSNKKLDYIEARKEIYGRVYIELVKSHPLFKDLKQRLLNGENLLILEVDGPHQESLDYYKKNYNVDDDFIQGNTMLINENNINIMLNDKKHPFGHGYCIASALLDIEI